jgi:membrane protease YdiL (CAAX protease family)
MAALTPYLREGFIWMSPWTKVLLLAAIWLVFLLVGTIFAAILAMPLFGLTMGGVYEALGNPDEGSIGVLKYFQIIQTVFMFLAPAVVAAWLYSDDMQDYLSLKRKPALLTLLLSAITLALSIPLMNLVTELNASMQLPMAMQGIESRIRAMEEAAGKLTELFLVDHGLGGLAVNLLMIAILPAISEEILFRGVIQRLFTDMTRNRHLGIWIAAFVFSFIHFQFYGFLPRFMLGIFFGYLLMWSGSIWVPVTAHLANNGIAVLYYHFNPGTMGESQLDKLGTEVGGHALIYMSVFLTALTIGVIYAREREKRSVV